jgi:transposase
MTGSKEQVVVIETQRKRRWSLSEKQAMVMETYLAGVSVSSVARKYGINPSQLFYWRKAMEQGGLAGIQSNEGVVPQNEFKAMAQKVRELQRLLGKATMENEILRDAVTLARQKKLISRQPLFGVEGME